MREATPGARHFGYLGMAYQTTNPTAEAMTVAAAQLGVELTARWIDGPADYPVAFGAMSKAGVAGVVIGAAQPLASDALRVAASAADNALPTICEWEYMARAGCVLSYGHDLTYAQRRVGEYVARILKGAVPSDLPVEQSDAWKLTVNARAAQRLDLVLPPAILARADEVIE